jgi:hypothetical protein
MTQTPASSPRAGARAWRRAAACHSLSHPPFRLPCDAQALHAQRSPGRSRATSVPPGEVSRSPCSRHANPSPRSSMRAPQSGGVHAMPPKAMESSHAILVGIRPRRARVTDVWPPDLLPKTRCASATEPLPREGPPNRPLSIYVSPPWPRNSRMTSRRQ